VPFEVSISKFNSPQGQRDGTLPQPIKDKYQFNLGLLKGMLKIKVRNIE